MRLTLLLTVLAACHGAYRDHEGVGPDAREGADAVPQSDAPTSASGVVDPSNSNVFGGIAGNGLVIAPPNGSFDTNSQCTASAALGACTVASRGDGLGDACVCRADQLAIGNLKVTGTRALVLIVTDRVTVTGTLDVSADNATDGPGASHRFGADETGTVGGLGGAYATDGAGASGVQGVAAAYGDPSLVPLLGGMAGQGGGGGAGGGAGGALQITAGTSIEVDGIINAGGGGGQAGASTYASSGAGGGGSGGAILLEAPSVTVTGSVVANGGGGGGGGGDNGYGTNGDGGNVTMAYGGAGHDGAGCPLYGYVSGGGGGHGAIEGAVAGAGGSSDYDSRCIGPVSFVGGGGGGGAVGRIRVNTKTGCGCSGTFSPSPSFGIVTVQP